MMEANTLGGPVAAFLVRVRLRNYKSIAECDVALGPLTFLVGPNGAGKSNFLDALHFVADALQFSLYQALRNRGGINEVRRRSGGHPTHFAIHLEFNLPDGSRCEYSFEVGAQAHGEYEVRNEALSIERVMQTPVSFHVRSGEILTTSQEGPAASPDSLYLGNVSGIDVFRPAYRALAHMGFYNLQPDAIRDLQPPDPGLLLSRDGSNIASVLQRLGRQSPGSKARIEEFLGIVVPGVEGVKTKNFGSKETLEFRQQVAGQKYPWAFLASNMSDGTLRALGVLVALFQAGAGNGNRSVFLVGIEEPEAALHPAASGVLLDSLREASRSAQIIVTSHSPDLLDDTSIETDAILAVVSEAGETKIGRLDNAGREALRNNLYTAGELLRIDQLRPEQASGHIEPDSSLQMFD